MTRKHESAHLTFSPSDSLDARMELFRRLVGYAATEEEKERSLGLFVRGSLLARFLAVTDVYKQIIGIPGAVFDVGTWRGQTAVLCENLRAIYEPLNFGRRIVCFDTFVGYTGFSDKDRPTELHRDGTYGVGGTDYAEYLRELLVLHEKNNAMGHNHGKHRIVVGDCRLTIPQFFVDHTNEYVSLAFFDLNSYEPTLDAFEHVWARMVPGGIAAFWQLTRGSSIPAEGRVYAERILPTHGHRLRYAPTYPGLCYLVKP